MTLNTTTRSAPILCTAVWPSAAHGGMWDAQCPNLAVTEYEGSSYCAECLPSVVEPFYYATTATHVRNRRTGFCLLHQTIDGVSP